MANDKRKPAGGGGKRPSIPARPTELFRTVPVPRPLKDSREAADQLAEEVRKDRRALRVTIRPTDARLLYRFLRRDNGLRIGSTFEGAVFDISSSGLKFRGFLPEGVAGETLTDGDILVGVNVFFLSVDDPFKALGRVAWMKPAKKENEFEMGVEFLDKAEDANQILNAYLIHTGTRRLR